MIEGFGVMLSGLWGSGVGLTSYSGNIGTIGITKVSLLTGVKGRPLQVIVLLSVRNRVKHLGGGGLSI